MPSFQEISCDQLNRLIGTGKCPVLVDVRVDEDFNAGSRLIPGSRRRDFRRSVALAGGKWQARPDLQ